MGAVVIASAPPEGSRKDTCQYFLAPYLLHSTGRIVFSKSPLPKLSPELIFQEDNYF